MKKHIKHLAAVLAAAFAGVLPALAVPTNMESTLNEMSTTISTWTRPLVNLVLIALGIFAVGRSVSAYIRSKHSQGGGNDELMSMIATTLIVVGFIFLINVIFFK